jgi:hypothetical protein
VPPRIRRALCRWPCSGRERLLAIAEVYPVAEVYNISDPRYGDTLGHIEMGGSVELVHGEVTANWVDARGVVVGLINWHTSQLLRGDAYIATASPNVTRKKQR